MSKDLKVGHLMAITHYVKVEKAMAHELSVTDVDSGNKFNIIGDSLIESMKSADIVTKELKKSRTEIAQLLTESYNVPMTVVFDKADGTERKLRGRLVKPEPLLGRSMMEDLDETGANKLRQVDHRTLKSLIVDGVRYTVKG